VVVVTPSITVSVPGVGSKDAGQLDLPMFVLRDLVAEQLGYTPEELFEVRDTSQIRSDPRIRPPPQCRPATAAK